MPTRFDRAGFQALLGLDDATLARFDAYAALLTRWQQRINLVGPATLAEVWHRHFADSAQLLLAWRNAGRADPATILDIGSGAGFPGLVLAILTDAKVHLVEADQRKAAFLRQAALATGANPDLHRQRIESVAPFPADIITARACAPLERLLPWALPFAHTHTEFWFLKGQDADAELTRLEKSWTVTVGGYASRTDPAARILRLRDIRPKSPPEGAQ
ncbi:MAG: 16S rRNA (guanine(527)-N(7))-methyltransferase RsmG [Rhodothalassiaceae bacterium]